jgi:hypothetical protein
MAAGDVVNVMLLGASQFYQPAAGVEIVILQQFMDAVNGNYGITSNGTNYASNYFIYNSAGEGVLTLSKLAITNGFYYRAHNTDTNVGFSGIQIK